MKRLLITKNFNNGDLKFITSELKKNWEIIIPQSLDEATIISFSSEADAFLGYYITENIIRHSPKLRLIQLPGAGINNVNSNLLIGKDNPKVKKL